MSDLVNLADAANTMPVGVLLLVQHGWRVRAVMPDEEPNSLVWRASRGADERSARDPMELLGLCVLTDEAPENDLMAYGEAPSETLVTLHVFGPEFDLAECTALLGAEPTRTKGSRASEDSATRTTLWRRSGDWRPVLEDGVSGDERVAEFLDQFEVDATGFQTFVDRHALSVVVECAVRQAGTQVLCELSASTMRRLVALRAEFCFDLYDFRG